MEKVIVDMLFLLANLAVFALNLKLYTEIFKEKSQNRRAEQATKADTESPARLT